MKLKDPKLQGKTKTIPLKKSQLITYESYCEQIYNQYNIKNVGFQHKIYCQILWYIIDNKPKNTLIYDSFRQTCLIDESFKIPNCKKFIEKLLLEKLFFDKNRT
jgi:hypothetical protein